ncbi:hypothetical protein Tco_0299190 [Tanacetum coccineum]
MSSSTSYATVTYTSMSSDDDVPSSEPAKAQPLPAYVSPTVLLPDYSTDFEPIEEDLEKDPEKEPEENPEEEPFEEEDPLAPDELSAPTDSPSARLYIDLPSEVKEDEVPSTPPSPTSSPISSFYSILDFVVNGSRFAAPSHRFEIGESSAAAAARKPGSALAQGTEYGFVTALEEVNERVTDLATSHRLDSHEMHSRRPYMLDRLGLAPWIRDRARKDARDPERHDGPTDAGSSC